MVINSLPETLPYLGVIYEIVAVFVDLYEIILRSTKFDPILSLGVQFVLVAVSDFAIRP
jgi:hypothetical protein